jgi:hypothetical protein
MMMFTYRPASRYGNGSIKVLSMMLKIAVEAPIPSASVRIATIANPGDCRNVRTA